jgi:hypothetical protein
MATGQITIVKASDADEPAPRVRGQTKQPEIGQFRLQVDRQTKGSYQTYEAAERAGLVVKEAHPILQVAVYDTSGGINKILEVPKR